MKEMDRERQRALRWSEALILIPCVLVSMLGLFAVETCIPRIAVASPQSSATAVVDPTSSNEGYLAVLYDNKNGLPTSEANDIVQTADGFIWIGSYSGLIRYDGNDFVPMGASDGIASVRTLLVDSKDRLWVGTGDDGLFLMEQGSFRRWAEEDGMPSASIKGIVEDDNGDIYVATARGLAILDEDFTIRTIKDFRIAEAYIAELSLGSDKRLYGLTIDGDLFILRNEAIDFYLGRKSFPGEGASSVFPDPNAPGEVYLETVDSKVRYGRIEDGVDTMKDIDISPLTQVMQFKYVDDKIWLCTRDGLGVLGDDGVKVLDELPMTNSVGNVIADFSGNLWFTSTRQGVMKITPCRFVDVFARNGLSEEVVNSTCLYDGTLLIATDTGMKAVDAQGVVSSIPLWRAVTASGKDMGATDLLELLDGVRIRSIAKDSKGRLWIATWRKYGLLRLENGELTSFSMDDGMVSDYVRAICEREDGSIVVAATGGVNVIEDDRVVALYDEDDGVTNTEILSVAEGFGGDILCGTDGGGIYVIGEDGARHIGKKEGMRSEAVMRIKRDAELDVFWFVTGNSIGYLDSDYQVHLVDGFPYSNNFDLYQNNKGEMWVLSSDGIYVALTEDMLAGKEVSTLHYGIADGLPCIATANSYSELTDDGDLYIAGSTKVAKVNINASYQEARSIKATIPYVDVDGVRTYPNKDGVFDIPAYARKLTIYGFVLNYSLVNPPVSYWLEGFDQSNVTVASSELNPVDYTNLRGGEYSFVMKLEDTMHKKAKTVSAKIIKEKALYEQPWFYMLVTLALGLALWASVKRYVRHKMQVLEERHREEAEKERMEAEKERVENELSMARRIQESALPRDFLAFSGRFDVDIYATMEPAKGVGGDFYDFFMVDNTHLCLLIADVSGKGIPAALFMMVSKNILKNAAMLGVSPAQILEEANQTIFMTNETNTFVTVWLGILDLTTGRLVAANAGHEYPVIKQGNKAFELLKDKHGLIVGIMEGFPYMEYELQLEPGDKIFLYTDGLAEANNEQGELFGFDRIVEALNRNPNGTPQQILETMHDAVDEFVQEAEQFDDLTMMCVEYQ